MFGLFRGRRRRRILTQEAIPDEIWEGVVARVPVLASLDAATRERLRALVLLFLHEKRIEPAGGLALDDAMRVRIAALACLPILELGLDAYDGVLSVIVYPDEFIVPNRETIDEAGVVHVGDDVLSGEAWEFGPVILSWQDVEGSGLGEGFNVVAHEFAHKLDLQSGEGDGTPPLHRDMRLAEWRAAFDAGYEDLIRRLDAGAEPWIDPYAAEDAGEFFAVSVELFFDVPAELKSEMPAVYAQLAQFFRQDPAGHGAA